MKKCISLKKKTTRNQDKLTMALPNINLMVSVTYKKP